MCFCLCVWLLLFVVFCVGLFVVVGFLGGFFGGVLVCF